MNNSASSSNTLQEALDRYKNALNCLTFPNSSPDKNQVLEIFSTRDALSKLLETENSISPPILSELVYLDSVLKEKAYQIDRVTDLSEYRNSLPTRSQTWLSDIEKAQKFHWNHFERGIQSAKRLIWIVNVPLFGKLATQFLTGGSGFLEVTLLALPGIKSLLEEQKELTKNEQKKFNYWLKQFSTFPNISKVQIFVASCLSAVFSANSLFLLCLGLIFWQQPSISNFYKNIGRIREKNQNLVLAEQNYLKAISFDSENYDAHYKLATIYEELQEFDKAQKEYLIAIRGEELSAYNNLAYWYIRQDKALEAISLLQKYENLIDRGDKQESQALKYNIAKNRGWAKFKAKQYEEAKDDLKAAIRLAKKEEKVIKNPGAAYCLYAKVLEAQTKQSKESNQSKLLKEIKMNWQQCKDLIQKRLGRKTINTEEYQWLYEAKQKLKDI